MNICRTILARVVLLSMMGISMQVASACGGGSPAAPTADTTITITSSGVTPAEVRVPAGSRGTFFE